jgi:hypothetical protein
MSPDVNNVGCCFVDCVQAAEMVAVISRRAVVVGSCPGGKPGSGAHFTEDGTRTQLNNTQQ